jgi:DNA-binding CsgD family transcriptional regulator/tetratricopeptide (TPR) repeat protein
VTATAHDRLPGRSRELSTLTETVRRVRTGRAAAVVVRGPAGIGKTALIGALRRTVLAAGFTVLDAACREPASGVGYAAVRDLFAGHGPDGLLAPGSRALLIASEHRSVAAAPPLGRGPVSSEFDAYQVQHDLYRLTVSLMDTQPLAILLDDAQWCDERSLRWLDFLLRRAGHLPLLVVLGLRTGAGEPAGAIVDLLARPDRGTLDLGPLAPAAVAELTRRALGEKGDPGFLAACADVTGSNPLLLGRLLGELAGAGRRPVEAEIGEVTRIGRDLQAESAAGRLGGLPESVREVARALAVAGPLTPVTGPLTPGAGGAAQAVSDLTGEPPPRAAVAVAALRQIEMLAGDSLAFRHDAVRAAIAGGVPADEAERLRVRAAQLCNDAGRPSTEVADHLVHLRELPEPWMLGALRDAVAAAEVAGDTEATVRYLRRLAEATEDPGERARLRVQLARPLAHLDPDAALAQLRLGLDGIVDPRARARAAVQIGLTSLGAQRAAEGTHVLLAALDGLLAVLDPEPDLTAADRELLTLVESALLVTGAEQRSTARVVRAHARLLVPPPGHTPAERQMLGMMAVLAAAENRPAAEVAELAKRAVRTRARDSDWAVLSAAISLHLADEVDASLAAFDYVVSAGRERTAIWTHALALSYRGLLHHGTGRLAEAIVDTEAAVQLSDLEGWPTTVSMPRIALALTLVAQGDAIRAEEQLDRLDPRGIESHVWDSPYYSLARARARWSLRDGEGALRYLRQCRLSLDESDTTNPVLASWWVDFACVLAELGRPGEAAPTVARAVERAAQWATPRAVGLGLLARGVLETGRARRRLLTEAVEVLAASPARLELAHAEYRLGAALLDNGEVRAARDRLGKALDTATRGGGVLLARSAERLRLSAGGRRRRPVGSIVDSLTRGERRVAELAAQGRSNREISDALFVTVRTVEMHLTNTYRKLGVQSRTELADVLDVQQPPGASPA